MTHREAMTGASPTAVILAALAGLSDEEAFRALQQAATAINARRQEAAHRREA